MNLATFIMIEVTGWIALFGLSSVVIAEMEWQRVSREWPDERRAGR